MNKDKGYISSILWFIGGSIIGMVAIFIIGRLIGKTDQAIAILCVPWLVNGSLIIRQVYFKKCI